MILRKRCGTRRGAVAVETALVISLVLLFMFGVLEYGRLLFFMHVANNAVREGARFAAVHTGDGTTQAQVQSYVQTQLGSQQSYLTGLTVNVFNANPSTGAAIPSTNWNDSTFTGDIAVQVTGTYTFIASSFLGLASPSINFKATAMMTSETN
jgi:Flp pilus assembly protein TadG